MQFVILKDDYCMDKYGIELNSKKPSGFKDYFLTGEYNRRSLSPSHNITHIDETEVPEDARNALKTVYSAWKKYSSADAGQSEELLSKLEKEYEDALKMLREFSCKDEISLSEFVQEFLKQLPSSSTPQIQTVELEDLPVRPDRTTRLRITASPVANDKIEVEIRDLGFGEFFPATGRAWKSIIMMG